MPNPNIALVCQYNPENDQLQIVRSQSFDALDVGSRYTISDAVSDIIGAMNEVIDGISPSGNFENLFNGTRSFILEFGYDYATNLQQARQQYGEQGYRDELTAIGKSTASFIIGAAGSSTGKAIGLAISSTTGGKIAGAVVGGIISSKFYRDNIEQPSEEFFNSLISPSLTLNPNQAPKVEIRTEANGSSASETRTFDVVPSHNFQNLLSQYGLNNNLLDYSNLAPSFIVNDGQGGNFNMLAFAQLC